MSVGDLVGKDRVCVCQGKIGVCCALAALRALWMARRRIEKELQAIQTDPPDHASCWLVDEDLFHWTARINGPDTTPYAGGQFMLDLRIPPDYPHKPPHVRFRTRIYHPNIDGGGIHLYELASGWSPALNISRMLLRIVELLCEPNVERPLVWAIAMQYLHDRDAFTREAQRRTRAFAMGDHSVVLPREIPSLFSLAAYQVDTLASVPWQLHEAVNIARVLKPMAELATVMSTSPVSGVGNRVCDRSWAVDYPRSIPSLFSLAASQLDTLADVPQMLHASVNKARVQTVKRKRHASLWLDPSTYYLRKGSI